MAQVRVEKSNNFTMILNEVAQNPELSLKAKGLLLYMLSLPSDWDYSIEGLSAKCREGKTAIRGAVAELMEAGHIARSLVRAGGGKLGGYEYVVYDVPRPSSENRTAAEASPSSDYPTTEKPTSDNPSSENRTQTKKNKTKKEIEPPTPLKKWREKIAPDVLAVLDGYTAEKPSVAAAMEAYLEARVAKRAIPRTVKAAELIIRKLDQLSGGDDAVKVAILEQSVERSWTGLFALDKPRDTGGGDRPAAEREWGIDAI